MRARGYCKVWHLQWLQRAELDAAASPFFWDPKPLLLNFVLTFLQMHRSGGMRFLTVLMHVSSASSHSIAVLYVFATCLDA